MEDEQGNIQPPQPPESQQGAQVISESSVSAEIITAKPLHPIAQVYADAKEKHRIKREEIINSLPDLAGLDYLESKLNNEDLKYYLILKRKYIEEDGLPEGPLLNQLLFFALTSKNLELKYIKMVSEKESEKKAMEVLRSLLGMIPKLEKLLLSMKELVELSTKTKGIHDLIEETLSNSEKFIREHVGEHVLKCNNCNSIVGTDGLPHWAIQGKYKHHVFSPAGWKLFVSGKITLAQLAYMLMTSPEGVLWTAQERGDKIPENVNLKNAEIELKEYQSYV